MTVLELLIDHLPNRYVNAVIKNIEDANVLNYEAGSFSSELMTLFDWNDSIEGYDFWNEVLECVLYNEELPEIPISIDYCPSTMFLCDNVLYIMNISDTGVNVVLDIDLSQLKSVEEHKKEKVLAFLN